MRKFGLFSLLALLAAAPACGSGNNGDGGVDGVVADAGPPPDAQRGEIGNFNACNNDPDNIDQLPPCDCEEDIDCADPNSECVEIAWFLDPPKQCLPKCGTTNDCPFDSVCYPTTGGSMGAGFRDMGDHCWFSYCGEMFDVYELGVAGTYEPCMLGQEMDAPVSDQRPGWCASIDDGNWGRCNETGDVPPGGACDWLSLDQVRGGANCDQTSLCIGSRAAGNDFCRQICDAEALMTGGDPGCTAEPGTVCRDASSIQTLVATDRIRRRSNAWCQEFVDACVTIGPNTCPDDEGVPTGCRAWRDADGLRLGSTLRATGLCDVEAQGSLQEGEPGCVVDDDDTDEDAEECAHGLVCVGGTCRALCNRPLRECGKDTECGYDEICTAGRCAPPYSLPPGPDCAAIDPSFTCKPFFASDGFDNAVGTADDDFTYEWGACRP